MYAKQHYKTLHKKYLKQTNEEAQAASEKKVTKSRTDNWKHYKFLWCSKVIRKLEERHNLSEGVLRSVIKKEYMSSEEDAPKSADPADLEEWKQYSSQYISRAQKALLVVPKKWQAFLVSLTGVYAFDLVNNINIYKPAQSNLLCTR